MESSKLVTHAQSSLSDVTNKLMDWLDHAITMLPNLAVALLVLALFLLAARLGARVTRSGLHRTAQSAQVVSLAAQGVRFAIFGTGVFVALGVMGLDKTVSSLLAGVGILGLAIGFAFQDLLANLMSGVLLAFRRPFERGDLVETSGVMGHIEDTKLTSTLVRTFQGQLVWIPNKSLLESVMTNYSRSGERRVEVPVGISYGDDIDVAEKALLEALNALPFRHPKKEAEVMFLGFGDSSVDLRAQVWLDLSNPDWGFLPAKSETVKAVKRAIDGAGLTIPFPIRTLDFGILGGDPLSQHLKVLNGRRGGEARRAKDSENGSSPTAEA